jgi:2-methylcitrate dehydratase
LAAPCPFTPPSRNPADHSLHFLIAVTLIDGRFGLAQFAGERWNDAKVRTLMARLETTVDADIAQRAGSAYPCALDATGRDGRRHTVEILAPPGFSPSGLDAQTVLEKFARLTADRMSAAACERIVDAIMMLDKVKTCDHLLRALAPRAPPAAALHSA